MFNPGPRGTLLSDIIDLALPSGQHYDPDLYIQGVTEGNPAPIAVAQFRQLAPSPAKW